MWDYLIKGVRTIQKIILTMIGISPLKMGKSLKSALTFR